ncbi:MAG: ATP-binding cassette domain-containing protein [Clostridium sp.]|uniref:methionine ABC transporter ATP-binding protein n=1 Tax=Clostridium sp. TaxID=1506 RepID=UPI002A8AC8AB|nr:ATP-binding cassette domain-containing protein [Clostridium sp.]MDY5097432.1 ATP-binding cassette domain-containing protein [Clostridium sp.]
MIEIRNCNKTFKTDGREVQALKNVNLNIEEGDIYGIIGYSGAGKSTLIRCINLLEKPDEGDVVVEGKSLISLGKRELREVRKDIGMIFQHFNLMNSISVYENIAAPLKNHTGLGKREIDEKVKELLKIVDLEDKIKAYPSQLSGGQKQRVAIARALSVNPKILLCDEATSALDPNTTKSILKLIKKINDEMGITVVIITHQMEVVKSICNKVAIMEKGEVVEKGDLISIFSDPKTTIAKDFIAQTMHTDEFLEKVQDAKKNLFKISFVGDITDTPLISNAMKASRATINILYGNIEKLCDSMIGNLIVEIRGTESEVQDTIDYLSENGAKVEVVANV